MSRAKLKTDSSVHMDSFYLMLFSLASYDSHLSRSVEVTTTLKYAESIIDRVPIPLIIPFFFFPSLHLLFERYDLVFMKENFKMPE